MDYKIIISELMENHRELEGILASNDIIAAQIVQYCKENDISVPEQMKIIGYDDTDFAALCSPGLTTIHQPIKEICIYCVENIFLELNHELVPSSTVFPVRLVRRNTT